MTTKSTMTTSGNYILIFDIGKTTIKLHVLDEAFNSVHSLQTPNQVDHTGPYPHFDTDKTWNWLLDAIKEAAALYPISALTITTHGAAAALINRRAVTDTLGLVLPVIDYEFSGFESTRENYVKMRPDFCETYSPLLPGGLNIGQQLYWQQQQFPEEFARATDILMYPQYWAWRLTGDLCSEVTSLGCHTDLWNPTKGDFSSLVQTMKWQDLFPSLTPAWTRLRCVKPALRERTGLAATCHVHAGIHDSNASFLRYRLREPDKPFTVVSTGTWTILLAAGVALDRLDESRDMLANVDAQGKPVACARFMGGREFGLICHATGSTIDQEFNEDDLQNIIDSNSMALPDFGEHSGPFGGRKSEIIGNAQNFKGTALASLYSALMIDYQLDMLHARGDIYMEGAFIQNQYLCAVLNQLRPGQNVYLSLDKTGTVKGSACLTNWGHSSIEIEITKSATTKLKQLTEYKSRWRKRCETVALP
ncbi:MAG: hypothetical protein JKY34_05890 [Kordiimonadaceae bacterium]|nr:hypothetical protein [Kordiimonadaceae bacterium]